MQRNGFDRVAAAWGFCFGIAAAVAMTWVNWRTVGRFYADPDDAMRLVQVRDWLAGQAWADWTQHRMQPPEGVGMHWSRIDDLPVGAVVAALRGWLGQAEAERIAMLAWPVALVPVLFAAGAGASQPAPGRRSALLRAAVTSAGCCSAALLVRFMPGRIDHHALMTTLTAAACATLLIAPSRRAGIFAGLCVALCLGVGFEDLIVLAVAGVCAAGLWLAGDDRYPLGFAEGLLVGTLGTAAVFVQPDMLAATACDALSGGWIAAVAAASAGLMACVRTLSGKPFAVRAAAAAAVAVAAAAVFVAASPECLAGPFAALPPTIKGFWLGHVGEMRSVFHATAGRADAVFAYAAVPLLGLLATAALVASKERDARAVAYLAVLATATAVGMTFVRNSGLPLALAAPAVAHAMASLVGRPDERSRTLLCAMAMATPLPMAVGAYDALWTDARGDVGVRLSMECSASKAWREFAALPPSTVMAPIDVGPFLLLNTPHSPVGGGYHRAVRGLATTIDFLIDNPDKAGKALADSKADYVAWCADSPELRMISTEAKRSMAAKLKTGDLPDWLEPAGAKGVVRYARVLKDKLPKPQGPDAPAPGENH